MRAFQQAAVARAEAVWNAAQVHEIGGIPQSPRTPYLAAGVSSSMGDTYRLSAEHGSKMYRLAVQAVGRDASEIGFAVDKAEAAYLDHRLDVPGYDTTPMQAEVASPIIRDPDGGVLLTVTLTYTFHAYPTE